jgi:predicted oxidoreductase
MFEGVFLDNPTFPELNAVIDRIAKERDVTNTAIAVAWISRHRRACRPSWAPERRSGFGMRL